MNAEIEYQLLREKYLKFAGSSMIDPTPANAFNDKRRNDADLYISSVDCQSFCHGYIS